MTIDPHLLEILVCPACRGPLEHRGEQGRLVCARCRLAYDVREGIPVMLVEEAKPVSD